MNLALSIYQHYIGPHYQVGQKICSPLPATVRKPDHKPSFSTKDIGNTIIWHDFGYESQYGYGPIGFVAVMEGVDYEQAKEIIRNKGFRASTYVKPQLTDLMAKKPELKFETTMLQAEHYQYFDMLLVEPKWLHFYGYEAVDTVAMGQKVIWKGNDSNIGFYKRIGAGDKGYFPYNKAYSKLPKVLHQKIDILEGWDELPPSGKLLIITKSLKDVIVLRSCGYNAVSLSSETSVNIFKLYYWQLSERFENIVVWGDPDAAGAVLVRNVKKYIPRAKEAKSIIDKDPSDIILITRNRFYINLIIDRALKS